jgi:hypothetical protein
MAERRSLGDAMTLTPEKVAFIHGSPAKSEKTPPSAKAREDVEKTIELEEPAKVEAAESTRPQRRRSRGRGSSQEQPQANEILDQILVPVTIRLQHRTAQALKRVHLEQRLSHAKPDTQQEIVEEAIQEWLGKRGFLD